MNFHSPFRGLMLIPLREIKPEIDSISIGIQVLPDYSNAKLKTHPQKNWLRQAQPAPLLLSPPEREAVEDNPLLPTVGIPID